MRLCTNSLLKSLLKTKDDWNVSQLEEQLYGLLSQLQKAGAKQVVEPNREKAEKILSNEVKVPSDRTVYYCLMDAKVSRLKRISLPSTQHQRYCPKMLPMHQKRLTNTLIH
jgi:hypothetical protein